MFVAGMVCFVVARILHLIEKSVYVCRICKKEVLPIHRHIFSMIDADKLYNYAGFGYVAVIIPWLKQVRYFNRDFVFGKFRPVSYGDLESSVVYIFTGEREDLAKHISHIYESGNVDYDYLVSMAKSLEVFDILYDNMTDEARYMMLCEVDSKIE